MNDKDKDIVTPGRGLLFMKIGTHANEPLEEIIARKTKEIDDTGYAFWGYGGATCHPQKMVQPFANGFHRKGETIYLCMHEMNSRHFADQIRADEFSTDGIDWTTIPAPVNVLGSRYALVVKNLRRVEFDLPLHQTRVAIGNSMGISGDRYISGRVDKGCFEITEPDPSKDSRVVLIRLMAEIIKPYAVYVRNRT